MSGPQSIAALGAGFAKGFGGVLLQKRQQQHDDQMNLLKLRLEGVKAAHERDPNNPAILQLYQELIESAMTGGKGKGTKGKGPKGSGGADAGALLQAVLGVGGGGGGPQAGAGVPPAAPAASAPAAARVGEVSGPSAQGDQTAQPAAPAAPSGAPAPAGGPSNVYRSQSEIAAENARVQFEQQQSLYEMFKRHFPDWSDDELRAAAGIKESAAAKRAPQPGSLGDMVLNAVAEAEATKGGRLTSSERQDVIKKAREEYSAAGRKPDAIFQSLAPALKERVQELLGQQKITPNVATEEQIRSVIAQASAELRREASAKLQSTIVRIENGKATDSDIKEAAESVSRGELLISQAGAFGTQRLKLVGEVNRIRREKGLKPLNYLQQQLDYYEQQRQIATLRGANMTNYLALSDSVVRTMKEMSEIANELRQGDVRLWNKVTRNTVQQVYGNTPQSQLAVRYVTAANELKTELGQLMRQGHVPTDATLKNSDEILNKDFGFKDMDASLFESQRIINYRTQAIEKRLESGADFSQGAKSGPKEGDEGTVNGKRVKITKIHPDGTFDYDEIKK